MLKGEVTVLKGEAYVVAVVEGVGETCKVLCNLLKDEILVAVCGG